jgi:hypothetical protein
MKRREFLSSSFAFPLLINNFLKQEEVDISKLIDYVNKEKYIVSGKINNKDYRYHECEIAGGYKLQLSKDYFAIIIKKDNSFLFDFGMNNNIDIVIKNTIFFKEDIIMKNMEDAINAFNNKKVDNENLKIVKSLDDEINRIYKEEVRKIYSLLEL